MKLTRAKFATTLPFLFLIEDIYFVTGRGTIVTGVIKDGTCQVGQQVATLKNGVQVHRSVVDGIEAFKKVIQNAQTGEHVGILLRGVRKGELERGMTVVGLI